MPAGFDLDEFVAENFDYPVGKTPLKLAFRMDRVTAAHLDERPLAKDQQIDYGTHTIFIGRVIEVRRAL